ncbi:MAG: hypothetical protein OIF58_10455 [Cohaesibacter sp.]|nr:hypothetical protein [Cohaesibacter sp.]
MPASEKPEAKEENKPNKKHAKPARQHETRLLASLWSIDNRSLKAHA